MDSTQVFFNSRISARAIIAGTISTFALTILLLVLGGGFGLMNFELSRVNELNSGFLAWAYMAWIVSVYGGSYVAAISGRSVRARDGALHGFVVWATTCVAGCLFLGVLMLGVTIRGPMSVTMYWGAFVGDLLALIAALLAGTQASQIERKAERAEEKASGRRTEVRTAIAR